MALPELENEENLGVIKFKHPSGIRETDFEHKCMDGDIGDTLMRGTDRKCYIVTKAQMRERESTEPPKETAVQKKARIKAEADAAQKLIDDAEALKIADPGVLTGVGEQDETGDKDTENGGEE